MSDPCNYLCGASGAVYALIFAHLATLILNWNEDGEIYDERVKENKSNDDNFLPMELNPWIRGIRLAFIILFTFVELGTTIKNTYVNSCFFRTSYKKFKVLTILYINICCRSKRNTVEIQAMLGMLLGPLQELQLVLSS